MKLRNGIKYRKLPGLSGQGLRIWGLIFLAFGAALNPAISQAFASEEVPFLVTTVGLIMQLLHFCAIPIFAFLLVEGFQHTTSLKNYFGRVLLLALAVALPYNLATYGKLLGNFSFSEPMNFSLNPVFGLLLALVLLYFFRRYAGKALKYILLKVVLWLVAFLWVKMLKIEYGIPVVLLVPIIYFLRKKRVVMVFTGCMAMTLCSFLDGGLATFTLSEGIVAGAFMRMAGYVASAPIAFMIMHFYNGEKGESNRYVNYLAYPVMLLAIGLLAQFAL